MWWRATVEEGAQERVECRLVSWASQCRKMVDSGYRCLPIEREGGELHTHLHALTHTRTHLHTYTHKVVPGPWHSVIDVAIAESSGHSMHPSAAL